MSLSQAAVLEIAHTLHKAEHDRAPIAPLTEAHPDMTVADAYAVQLAGVQERLQAHGGRVIGWKVGLTSRAMQEMLGVNEPDFGHLLEGMQLEDGAELDTKAFIWPRVEPEVAFLLKDGLQGPGVSAADVLAATEYLVPALEVIDSRIRDWRIKLCDTIADNASCGRFVLGRRRTPAAGLDTKLIGMNYYVDGRLVATATSAAVLGDPAAAVAWLANTLAAYGQRLEAGQVVMPGSLVAAVDARPGGRVRADFAQLGPVELRLR